ncbi:MULTISPECIES: ATP-dependent DNA helicase [Aliiglaciecola]|uniref:ATP-dependent DNA helicase n=1 Tax=Aliiglaciecola TaxID=1406885 RepID=UPI001C09E194|nr:MULTISPECIES: ATP-dependent DNA helicase [Aliiglaciecola]MBU2880065.1 ATP-dependent DNA helicase [Aliiglaciecola lipolytica]MDO6710937.1 ATP-dependent DNA helicase [Aliiglaciecola sp. 2_MG-2023]MDO6752418.1 ATP-dependent DNA helicase [Aliiglaciecola sp. 1_MG-2023]
MIKTSELFAEDGVLSTAIAGFSPRASQIAMSEAIEQCIDDQVPLIVEAGTGTGKTFAYLAPAMISNKKAIISTGTKNLQEQLFHRDLPLLKKALASNRQAALLKGRSNYLCLHRLGQHSGNSTLLERETLDELTQVRQWASTTKTGDMGDLKSLSENARVLPLVTSTVDNCLGRDCPDYEDCYLVKARNKAMDADIVVVNHHLFFADMALKDTGFGELIPEADVVVFDEAHQIPDIASEYFGEALSSRQIHDLARDIEIIKRTQLKDAEQLVKVAEKCRLIAADLRILFPVTPERGNWRQMLKRPEVEAQINKLDESLTVLYEVVKIHLGREKELDTLFERVTHAKSKLAVLNDVNQKGVSLWYETTPKHIVLHLTPLSIAKRFADFIEEPKRSWVFTSATLMVDGGFAHFQRLMGLDNAKTLALDSPFDYQKQAILCVPRYLPEPSSREMRQNLLEVAVTLIKASKGRCFLLFTSHAMLKIIAQSLPEYIDNPILVQGTTTKRALLDEYVTNKQAVLLGTGAFWEGVDVRGDDLTCVMIDKLPFAAPDDPLLQARIEDCRKSGANPFAQIQIPQAVISLKQGAGRLIRDEKDKGVLVICDNRLITKDYAKTFLASLPPMKRTRDLSVAVDFLTELHTSEGL